MTMLTNDQIQQLFQFCSRHYVHHYDVQAELVDHMGSAIEEKMDTESGISFEKALDQVFLSFGPRGFAPIVRQKIETLQQRNRKEIGQGILDLFRWPAILTTAGLATLQWTCYRYAGTAALFISIALMALLAFGIQLRTFLKQRRRQTRPLLANDFMHSQLSVSSLAYMAFLLIQVYNFFKMATTEHAGPPIMLAILLDAQCILYISIVTAMRKNRLRLQRQYPLAFRV